MDKFILSINSGQIGILSSMFCTGIIGSIIIFSLPARLHTLYGYVSLICTGCMYIFSLFLWIFFDRHSLEIQHLEMYSNAWISKNINLCFGIDGLSLFFILLTTLIFPMCILACWKAPRRQYIFINILSIEVLLLMSFSVLDLFYFCVFFESIILPMFFIIMFWGVRSRRIFALTYFFMYTMLGSVFLFWALFIFYFEFQTTNYFALLQLINNGGGLLPAKQRLLWLLLFITFAIKIPIFPIHIWLPEAHVEAPTVGSVILAGLLLKIGGYGMLRFLFLIEDARFYYQPFALTICLFSVFYGSIMAIVQKDMKKIIAYSSVAHMNFAILGFFSNNFYGLIGGLCLMLSHGFVSSALFLLIGMVYERHHDRTVEHYGGLVQFMPVFTTCFFIFSVSNFSFPITSNFVGEFLVIVGLAMSSTKFIIVLAAISTFFGLAYTMLLFNKISFGQIKLPNYEKLSDLNRMEFYYLTPILSYNFIFGLFPTIILSTIFFHFQRYTLMRKQEHLYMSDFVIDYVLEETNAEGDTTRFLQEIFYEEPSSFDTLQQQESLNTSITYWNHPEHFNYTLDGLGAIGHSFEDVVMAAKYTNLDKINDIDLAIRYAARYVIQERLLDTVEIDTKDTAISYINNNEPGAAFFYFTPDFYTRRWVLDYLRILFQLVYQEPKLLNTVFAYDPNVAVLTDLTTDPQFINHPELFYCIKNIVIEELFHHAYKEQLLPALAIYLDQIFFNLAFCDDIKFPKDILELSTYPNIVQSLCCCEIDPCVEEYYGFDSHFPEIDNIDKWI